MHRMFARSSLLLVPLLLLACPSETPRSDNADVAATTSRPSSDTEATPTEKSVGETAKPDDNKEVPATDTKTADKGEEMAEDKPAAAPASQPDSKPAGAATAAKKRLEASEEGKIVLAAIEAHGGLETWLSYRKLTFNFDYAPVGKPDRRKYTANTIDLLTRKAHQKELGEGADATFGWNGEAAWIVPNKEAFAGSVRFWATTPFYFVGIPFLAADPGVVLTRMEDETLDGVKYQVVKMGFRAGVGDAPDDYYILMINPDTRLVGAIRYIVTYPPFFKDKKPERFREKLMVYAAYRTVKDTKIKIPHRLNTYAWDIEKKKQGDLVTEIKLTKVGFSKDIDDTIFEPPEGAVVSNELE